MKKFLSVLSLAGCIVLSGCSPQMAVVKGKVTLDGQPYTDANVMIYPKAGAPQSATIQPDGSYEVPELLVGDAIVTVSPNGPAQDAAYFEAMKYGKQLVKPPEDKSKPKLPTKYSDSGQTPLKTTLKSGMNEYNIEMTTK